MYTFICGTVYSGNAPHAWDAKDVCLIECLSHFKVESFRFPTYFVGGRYVKCTSEVSHSGRILTP